MAVRPDKDLGQQLLKPYTASGAITKGQQVVLGASDNLVVATVAEDQLAIGIATQAAADGDQVAIAMFGTGITHVVVGTGGATRGRLAVAVADGHTDVTIADGANVRVSPGRFLQTGVVGDEVGLLINQTIVTAA